MFCDVNCDMGEGIGNDEKIAPYITSANIACGYHAGDTFTMQQTIHLCKKYGIAIGVHPSFYDPMHFGRKEVPGISPNEVYALVTDQLHIFKTVLSDCHAPLHHVKPHGALYNMAAKDSLLSKAITQAIYDFDPACILYGLSGSCLVVEAQKIGVKAVCEVFADRTYIEDGTLTPRNNPHALITDIMQSVTQVVNMVTKSIVTTISGSIVSIKADTICIHGDGENAVDLAATLKETLLLNKITLRAP